MQTIKLSNSYDGDTKCVKAGTPGAFLTMGAESRTRGKDGVFMSVMVSLYDAQSIGGEPPPMLPADMVEQLHATVALIEAAPELLAACKAAALVLQSNDGAICDTVWMPDGSPETLLDHLLAAIAKAEGRAS